MSLLPFIRRLGVGPSFLGRFRRNRAGNIAMMFGLAAIPFFAFGGLAVDFSRALLVKNRLSSALDATALALGGQVGLTSAEVTAKANAYFLANYPDDEIGRPSALRIQYGDDAVVVAADATVDTLIMGIIGYNELSVTAEAEVRRSSNSLEVSLVLDVTGSMAGSRIADLKTAAADLVDIVVWDGQSSSDPQYSKLALIPYANAVNVGAYAAAVRGPVAAPASIASTAWTTGSSKTITGATRANPVVITSNAHGFNTGDFVYISGVSGMTQLNNKPYTITRVDANRFRLNSVNGSGYTSYSSGGTIRKCLVSDCGIVVTTSAAHAFNNGDNIFITGATGTGTQINSAANTTFTVANRTATTFSLAGAAGANYGTYSSGGAAHCTVAGCEYFRFTNASAATRVHRISTCVSERVGGDEYTDAAPSTRFLGRVYPAPSGNTCLASTIVPLTTDKTLLTSRINALAAAGSTAGQIGIAWGWYMLSPDFGYLWPSESQPAAYGADDLLKIAVLMTDGEFNTPYCNGVIAADAGSGSGSANDKINCNATNGDPFAQAAALCAGMKAEGVIVYTVGFDISDNVDVVNVLTNCATSPAHAKLADNGGDLQTVFRQIAVEISNLRVAR